jgi:hypothetical protein
MNEQTDKLFIASQTAADAIETIKQVASETDGTVAKAQTAVTDLAITKNAQFSDITVTINLTDNGDMPNNYKKIFIQVIVKDKVGNSDVETDLESLIQFQGETSGG